MFQINKIYIDNIMPNEMGLTIKIPNNDGTNPKVIKPTIISILLELLCCIPIRVEKVYNR